MHTLTFNLSYTHRRRGIKKARRLFRRAAYSGWDPFYLTAFGSPI